MAGGESQGSGQDELTPTAVVTLSVLAFLLAGGGNYVGQERSGAYQSGGQIGGLIVASAMVGLAAALSFLVGLSVVRKFTNQWAPLLKWPLVVVAALGAAALGFWLLNPAITRLWNEASGCDPAAEFTVVTTPGARDTADELVGAYERSTVAANGGCPSAHGYVYDAPEDVITSAIAGCPLWSTSSMTSS